MSQRARVDAKTWGETIFPPRFGWCWLRAAGQGWSQGSEEEEEDKESEDRYKMPSNPGFYQQWHQHRTSRAPGPPACSHNGQYTLSKTKKSYIKRIFRKKIVFNVERSSGKNRASDNWFAHEGRFSVFVICNFTVVSSTPEILSPGIFFYSENSRICSPGFLIVTDRPASLRIPRSVLDLSPARHGDTRSVFYLCQSSWKVQPLVTFSRTFFILASTHCSRWLLEVIVWGSFK